MNQGTTPVAASAAPATPLRRLPSLFEIGERLDAIDAAMAETCGEITPEIEQKFLAFLADTETALGFKLDNYVALIRREMAMESVARAQAEQYTMRANASKKLYENLKRIVLGFMLAHNAKQLQTATGIKVYAWGNGGKFPMVWKHETDGTELNINDPELARFVKTETIVRKTIDADALYAALTAGETFECVKLKPRGHHLRIV